MQDWIIGEAEQLFNTLERLKSEHVAKQLRCRQHVAKTFPYHEQVARAQVAEWSALQDQLIQNFTVSR